MTLPSVAQSQLPARTLRRIVTRFRPRSLVLLGAAGGNGLDGVDSNLMRRMVALDVNPDYLAVCTARHSASFAEFQPVLHDLSQGRPDVAPVECVFASLVSEYLRLEVFYSYLPSLLADNGIFATLLQLPSDSISEVSLTPYSSLTQFRPAFSFVSLVHLLDLACRLGFSLLAAERCDLDTGKSFYSALYQLTNRPLNNQAT